MNAAATIELTLLLPSASASVSVQAQLFVNELDRRLGCLRQIARIIGAVPMGNVR